MSTTSIESQMTYFPPIDVENQETSSTSTNIKPDVCHNNTNTGIINSLFNNLFFNSSSNLFNKNLLKKIDSNLEEEILITRSESLNDLNQSTSQANTSEINKMKDPSTNSTLKNKKNSISNNSLENKEKSLHKNLSLIKYKDSEFRRYWMPDATGRECYECYDKFNAFRRKHHCRLCGQIFCGKCSNYQINGANLGYSGVLRLCNFCANQVNGHVKNNISQKNLPVVVDINSPSHSTTNLNTIKKIDNETSKKKCFSNSINSNQSKSETTSLEQIESSENLSISSENKYLEELFEKNIEKSLDNLLERENLDSNLWKNLLFNLSKQIISKVLNFILKVPDALNIFDFVHIKKLPIFLQPSYEVINGVAFSKCLTHPLIKYKTNNVSLMLLAGNITYERVVEKLSSLEQIMLQEQEYLKTQVERVSSRRVTLLLVENSVSTLASEMLAAENISLATNVKHKVLQRIARAVNSDIITSLDAQFLQPRIGFASEFEQREYKMLDETKKIILVLTNHTDENAGVTILLHGSNLQELIAAKRVLKFLLVSRYSSKLEIAFLSMFNSTPGKPLSDSLSSTSKSSFDSDSTDNNNEKSTAKLQNENKNINFNLHKEETDCLLCEFNQICEAKNDKKPTKFQILMRKTQLSNSPAICFSPPFLETEAGQKSAILPYFKTPLYHFLTSEDLAEMRKSDNEIRASLSEIIKSCKNIRKDNENLCHVLLKDKLSPNELLNENLWTKFRTHSSLIFRRRHEINCFVEELKKNELNKILQKKKELDFDIFNSYSKSNDILCPYNRQKITFLYCANTRKMTQNAKTFCMGPYVLLRKFFFGQESGYKDTNLGVFLTNYCFNADYKCGSCERSMFDHLRRIVHRNARIEITTYALPRSGVTTGQLQDEVCLEDLPSSIPNMCCSSIICWRRCLRCSANSCIVSLSDVVYHLSFAKFIDYLANGTYWVSEFPTGNATGTCHHCTFHEHLHFFAHFNFITCFRVIPNRPLHVSFNAMICRIKPTKIQCKDLIETNYEFNSIALEIFDSAISFFENLEDQIITTTNQCCLKLSTGAESLLEFVKQFKTTFQNQIRDFDQDNIFKRTKFIESNDSYYLKSDSCLMICRYFLYSFITKWNSTKLDVIFVTVPINKILKNSESATNLSDNQSIKSKLDDISVLSSSSNAKNLSIEKLHDENASNESDLNLQKYESKNDVLEGNNFNNYVLKIIPNINLKSTMQNTNSKTNFTIPTELPIVANPLPKDIHFELPINNSAIFIRDLYDGKTNYADLGSVIAYTLASREYNERKKLKGKPDNENCVELMFGSDSKSKYVVKIYYAEEFESLRETLFGDGEEQFIRSISRSILWNPQGGKSGATFYRTTDERFVIKQMLRLEMESFKKCGSNYFNYIISAHQNKTLTALCKIYGVFGITISGKHQQKCCIDVLIMEYLFYDKNVKQIWDLKGSLRNRYASTKTEASVLLDENLVQDLWNNQLYVHPYSKAALNQAITNDCHFLSKQGIMDYSLLAGICHESDEVVIGIVDYMRQFTLDKKVESLVKTALPMAHSPTVVSPEVYCKRFYDAIDGYFVVAPDQWTHSDNLLFATNKF